MTRPLCDLGPSLRDFEFWPRALSLLGLALLTCISPAPLTAQAESPPVAPAATAMAEPTAIADVDISVRAVTSRDLVRQAESKIASDDRLIHIQETLPAEAQRVAALGEEIDALLEASGSTLFLQEAEKAALRARDRLVRWLRELSQRAEVLEKALRGLQDERSLWELTRGLEREDELPELLGDEIAETLRVLSGAEASLRAARNDVLALQAGIAEQQGLVEEMLAREREEVARRSAAILEIDGPPFWKAFRDAGGERLGVADEIRALTRRQWRDLRGYVTEEGTPLLTWLLLWVGLGLVLRRTRSKATGWAREDRSLETAVTVLARPMTAAAVLIAVLCNVVQVQAPTAWLDVLNLVLLVALLFLLLGASTKALHPLLYSLIPLYYFAQLVKLLPVGSLAQRLAVLAVSLIGVGFCEGLVRTLRRGSTRLPEVWMRAVVRGLRLGGLLFAVGLAVSLLGRVRFGALVVMGTTEAIFGGIVFWVVNVLLRSLVRVALVAGIARRVGIAPRHSEAVRVRLFRVIDFLTVAFWGAFTLKGFQLLAPAITRTVAILQAQLSVGELSISLGGFLLFALIVWLSVQLAALVEFILGELTLPRLRMPQGAPHAVSRLSRYTIIVIGVLVASRALGVELSQAALVVGGLGIGVGFGLQNVVSNFVAGLLLLFERPIRVGDIIEMGTTNGTVRRIGMRATLVETFTGSEIIVPNAKLISTEVVNWTLKSDRRRIELPVGVAYGSDPDAVVELLVATAAHQPEVDDVPPPECLFMGFGDSSLDFQLRAWTAASRVLVVASELRFAINGALREAGIEIPFPQRDLHLRSTGSETLASAAAGDEQA